MADAKYLSGWRKRGEKRGVSYGLRSATCAAPSPSKHLPVS